MVGCASTAREAPVAIQRGACPFECCQYGEWIAQGPIPVFPAELDTTEVAFQLAGQEPFTAITGNVHVRPVGLALVTAPIAPSPYERPDLELAPGDSVLVLDPVGEGYYRVRYRGEEVTVQGFWAAPGEDRSWYGSREIHGRLVRAPSYDWWVEVESASGGRGWIRVGHETPLLGHDGCG